MKRYLRKNYNLDDQSYYNIVVYGDLNYVPKCPYCNKPKEFWRLINGYYQTCASVDCISSIHSDNNQERWVELKLPENINSYKEFCSKLGLASGHKCANRAHYFKWLYAGEFDDLCQFYIAIKDDLFKFGVTSDIETRATFMGYSNYKVIFTGTRVQVGNLEFLIKQELQSRKEYLEFKDVYKFRRAYNKIRDLDLTNPID